MNRYQLSAISYQLSAISYQLSAISYQLSAISYQLSAQNKMALYQSKLCLFLKLTVIKTKNPSRSLGFKKAVLVKRNYFFFLTAFLFGKSVIEPSKISAARPIDSFNVG